MHTALEVEPFITHKDVEEFAKQYDSVQLTRSQRVTSQGTFVSSLDFERIVNQYSIQATRDQWLLPPLPLDGMVGSAPAGTSKTKLLSPFSLKRQLSIQGYRSKTKRATTCMFGYTGRTTARWLLTALVGLLTGLISNVVVSFLDKY